MISSGLRDTVKKPETEIRLLTSLRGFAALFVMFHHLRYAFVDVQGINFALFDLAFGAKGYMWVDFFFILSGFILAYRYCDEFRWSAPFLRKFWYSRWLRIYPLHFVTLVVFASYEIIFLGMGELTDHLMAFGANLLLVHGWGHHFGKSWNFPSWSLSAEFAAYLAFPIVIAVMMYLRRSILLNVLASVGLLCGLFVFYLETERSHANIAEVFGVVRCALEFSLGILLFQMRAWLAPRVSSAVASVIFVGAGCVGIALLQMKMSDFLFVPCAALVVLFGSFAQGRGVRILSGRIPYWLGLISFSVYMWHALIGRMFKDLYAHLGRPEMSVISGGLLFAVVCGVTLGFSTLSYEWIEKRLMRKLTIK